MKPLGRVKLILSLVLIPIGFALLFISTPHAPEGSNIPGFEYPPDVYIIIFKIILILILICLLTYAFAVGVIRNEKIRPLWKNIVFFLYSLFLIFLIFEGVFQFVAQSHSIGYTLAATRWEYFHWKPINNLGFRGKDVSADDLKTKKRIFMVGDSFTAGYGIKDIHDRYSDRLQKMLPDNYLVINMGVNGADTNGELHVIRSIPFKPDIIVLQYYPNDILGPAKRHGKDMEHLEIYDDIPPWIKFMVDNSFFLNFVYWQFPHTDATRYQDFLKNAFNDPAILEDHLKTLAIFSVYSKENNARLIAVLMPFLGDLDGSDFYLKEVKKLFRLSQVPFIDVTDLAKDLPPAKRMVNRHDHHASPLVHRRIADALYKKLLELKWIRE